MDQSDLLYFLQRPDSNVEQPNTTVAGPAVAESDKGDSHEVASISGIQLALIVIHPYQSAIAAVHAWTRAHGFSVTNRRAFYTSTTPTAVRKRDFDIDRRNARNTLLTTITSALCEASCARGAQLRLSCVQHLRRSRSGHEGSCTLETEAISRIIHHLRMPVFILSIDGELQQQTISHQRPRCRK
jgi:hypothetical protein